MDSRKPIPLKRVLSLSNRIKHIDKRFIVKLFTELNKLTVN